MAEILIISSNLNKWDKNLGGGVERTATLAEAFPEHNVTFLCFSWDKGSEILKIDKNITFVRPAIEERIFQKYKVDILRKAKNNYDITKYIYKDHLKIFTNKVKEYSQKADLVILDHVSASPFLEYIEKDIPIIYNSHNSELTMAKQIHPNDKFTNDIIQKMEEYALKKSVAITYCSKDDLEQIKNNYNVVPKKECYVPNGTTMQDNINYKKRMRSNNIIFVGTGHPPNIIAAQNVIEIAKLMPKYNFIICGTAGNAFKNKSLPINVVIKGFVEEKTLNDLLKESFAFINPMESGSGTHLKMMKALSYGIPIITSKIGARGFTEKEVKDSMIIANNIKEYKEAILSLTNENIYKNISRNSFLLSHQFDWQNIKKEYAKFVNDILKEFPKQEIKKEKILIYSIIRNTEPKFKQYVDQIKKIVARFPEYEFYLSIYENDSTDKTKQMLFSTDWSFVPNVSIISENINTQFFGSVKEEERVKNLSIARDKAINANNFIDVVDYVLMIEGDVKFDINSIEQLFNFKKVRPEFDMVSAVSIRRDGSHYDWWATRIGPIYNNKSELEENYRKKPYGEYYSTSNGLVFYKAKPFQKGIRHGWINKITKQFDCEMVVLCQNFRDKGFNNIYINYKSFVYV